MNAKQLKTIAMDAVDIYANSKGIGLDEYYKEPYWHAMAEAWYLEMLGTLSEIECITKGTYYKLAEQSLNRIDKGKIRVEKGYGWGLGFKYKECSEKETYLVTSALVLRSLRKIGDQLDCKDLVQGAYQGLHEYTNIPIKWNNKNIDLPVFCKSMPSIIENAIAVWADSVLTKGCQIKDDGVNEEKAKQALEWVSSKYLEQIGWAYSVRSSVVDLIHQTFIIEALVKNQEVARNERRAIEIFSNFRNGSSWVDSMETCSLREAIEASKKSKQCSVLFRGNKVLITKGKKARQWSLGGVLSSYGILGDKGLERQYWLTQIRRFPYSTLESFGNQNIRQFIYAARGAALSLKALKQEKLASESNTEEIKK